MEKQIKVSVIIPVYNVGSYLVDCLESVINQTMKDIEIICVDDASEDNCRHILETYAKKDTRIKLVLHDYNLGIVSARKHGVEIATGEYIMFLDADDAFYPDSCERAYLSIKMQNTDVVHFGTTVENCGKVPQERIEGVTRWIKPVFGRIETENNLLECWKEKKFGTPSWNLWNKIYKGNIVHRAFYEAEEEYIIYGEDLYVFFLIAFYSKTYYGMPDILYKYNFGVGVSGKSICELNHYKQILTEAKVYKTLHKFLQNKKLYINDYSGILNAIYEQSLNDGVKKWRDQLNASSKSDGFNLLVESYGLEDVLCLLTKTDWNPEVRIGELMAHIDYFYHEKREGKTRKTIAAYYKKIANGGAERVVAMLCNRWVEMRDADGQYLYNVVLVTDIEKLADEYELSEKVRRAYVPSCTASVKGNYRDRYRAWAAIVQKYDIDVVVCSLWLNPVIYWDMLAIKGQPSKPAFVIHCHNFCAVPFLHAGDTATSQIYKYVCCDGAVTLSQCDKLFVSAFNHHVEYIVNPIAFAPREIPLSTYNDKTIVWVGRISQEKQPADAIKMMKFVVEIIPDAKLIIVGDGDDNLKAQMRKLVQTHDLGENVEMVGFTLDVGRYYGRASVLVSTALYEGFPLTMGEAMAFGLPVVTYDMPWLSYIQDGRGVITVPQNNYELLAKKVIELLNNKEQIKKIGLCGRQHITEVAECNIENEWRIFFDTISGQQPGIYAKQDPASIVFKYITLFQYLGKHKTITNLTKTITNSMGQHIWKFITARLDIKNFGTDENTVEVIESSDNNAKIQFPAWFKNAQGQGVVIQSSKGDIRLKIRCSGNGVLNIVLRGVDCRDKNNNRVPVWIDFKKLNVNGKDIFTVSHVVCHDKPFRYKFNVVDGEKVSLDVAWWRAVD